MNEEMEEMRDWMRPVAMRSNNKSNWNWEEGPAHAIKAVSRRGFLRL